MANGLPEQLVSDNGSQFMSRESNTFVCPHITPLQMGLQRGWYRPLKLPCISLTRMDCYSHTNWPVFSSGTMPLLKELQLFHHLCCSSLHTSLDLLCPDPGATIIVNQALQQQQHDNHSRPRSLQVGQLVLVHDFHGSPRWVPATIVKELGSVSFMVQTSAGLLWKRHLDHICACVETPTPEAKPDGE